MCWPNIKHLIVQPCGSDQNKHVSNIRFQFCCKQMRESTDKSQLSNFNIFYHFSYIMTVTKVNTYRYTLIHVCIIFGMYYSQLAYWYVLGVWGGRGCEKGVQKAEKDLIEFDAMISGEAMSLVRDMELVGVKPHIILGVLYFQDSRHMGNEEKVSELLDVESWTSITSVEQVSLLKPMR